MENYEECIKIASRGQIPYPNQYRLTYILLEANKKLNNNKEVIILENKFNQIKKYSDYSINIDDF